MTFEAQKSGTTATGDCAVGWLWCPSSARLANNLPLTIAGVKYEFKVDASYVPTWGFVPIDVSSFWCWEPINGGAAVAAQIAAVIPNAFIDAASIRDIVRILARNPGTGWNMPITGEAAEVLSAVGMVGGAAAGSYTPGATSPLPLMGATSAEDVAGRLAGTIAWAMSTTPGMVVRRWGTTVDLCWSEKGAGDGVIGGTAAAALAATGMIGAIGVHPAVLTFVVTFPRLLTALEQQVAWALVDAAKRADTHCRFVFLDPTGAPQFQLAVTHLGYARLDRLAPRDTPPPSGAYIADPYQQVVGATEVVSLPLAAAALSSKLAIGSCYRVVVDHDAYLRQGNREVVATTNDMPVRAGEPITVTPITKDACFVSAIRAGGVAVTNMRITRIEGSI